MTNQEMLLAMSDMLLPIREDIHEIKTDVQTLKADMVEVKDRLSNVENDMIEVKDRLSNVENRITRIELTQENIMVPRLITIESCYTSTYNRYKDNVNDYENMKQDITVLKHIVSEHSKILQKIS